MRYDISGSAFYYMMLLIPVFWGGKFYPRAFYFTVRWSSPFSKGMVQSIFRKGVHCWPWEIISVIKYFKLKNHKDTGVNTEQKPFNTLSLPTAWRSERWIKSLATAGGTRHVLNSENPRTELWRLGISRSTYFWPQSWSESCNVGICQHWVLMSKSLNLHIKYASDTMK